MQISVLLLTSGCRRSYTDRQLFREAVDVLKGTESDDRSYALEEIATAQAKHGYYDDALETSRASHWEVPEILFADIVDARARNGDVAGAKKMLGQASPQEASPHAVQAIALAQAEAGDVAGARHTMQPLPPPFRPQVLEAIGKAQASKGDIQAALATASEIHLAGGGSDGVLYQVVKKLRERGELQQAHAIAKRMQDRAEALEAETGRASTPAEPTTGPCSLAWRDAKGGMLADAYRIIQDTKCDCVTVAIVHANGRDVDGAERAMRACTDTNPSDLSAYMIDVAEEFATNGDVPAALKFADAARIPDAFEGGVGYIAPALRDIAHAWTKKEGTVAVLKWARARPTDFERAMALLGVAESVPGKTHFRLKPWL
ncbi:MAG: tetratricopeptide repeat protein [Terriglobia bacterium]